MSATNKRDEWIHLQDQKSFSRILYTNPVCFLSTTYPQKSESKEEEVHSCNSSTIIHKRNVMVVSWLTATNNLGRFMMSINKRRFTASILIELCQNDNSCAAEFVLSVPVKGMEDLVLNVGKTSGRWTGGKFPLDHGNRHCDLVCGDEETDMHHTVDKRLRIQNKTKKKKRFENGIHGLKAVRLGSSSMAPEEDHDLFAIQGTVAHLHCKVYRIVDGVDGKAIDEDHHLILAEVMDAHVRKDYWNAEKRQFRVAAGQDEIQPYLTFLGSQSFGYVLS